MKRALLIVAGLACGCAADEPPGATWGGTYPVPDERVKYDPGAAVRALDQRGRQELAQGDLEAAGAAFDEAAQVNPFDPVALNNLAVARSEQGRWYEAEALLERAVRLAPGQVEIAANLARLREWLRTYAITPAEPTGVIPGEVVAPRVSGDGLPPEPPRLWDGS